MARRFAYELMTYAVAALECAHAIAESMARELRRKL